jgi:hypothetical protein
MALSHLTRRSSMIFVERASFRSSSFLSTTPSFFNSPPSSSRLLEGWQLGRQQTAHITIGRVTTKLLRDHGIIERTCDVEKEGTNKLEPEDIDLNQIIYSTPSEILQDQHKFLEEAFPDKDRPMKKKEHRKTLPPPTTFPPRDGLTVAEFLNRIKRNCEEHADKFASWEELMSLKGREMKEKGIPVAQRKWILAFVEHYKQGFSIDYTGKAIKK